MFGNKICKNIFRLLYENEEMTNRKKEWIKYFKILWNEIKIHLLQPSDGTFLGGREDLETERRMTPVLQTRSCPRWRTAGRSSCSTTRSTPACSSRRRSWRTRWHFSVVTLLTQTSTERGFAEKRSKTSENNLYPALHNIPLADDCGDPAETVADWCPLLPVPRGPPLPPWLAGSVSPVLPSVGRQSPQLEPGTSVLSEPSGQLAKVYYLRQYSL